MKTSEILDNAADIILEKGWCKNSYKNEEGQFCLMGAVQKAARDTQGGAKLARRAIEHDMEYSAELWNDRWYRMRFQVINLLRRTAEQQRKFGN